ncbi:protein YdgV [Enterobacter hormaechei]
MDNLFRTYFSTTLLCFQLRLLSGEQRWRSAL